MAKKQRWWVVKVWPKRGKPHLDIVKSVDCWCDSVIKGLYLTKGAANRSAEAGNDWSNTKKREVVEVEIKEKT